MVTVVVPEGIDVGVGMDLHDVAMGLFSPETFVADNGREKDVDAVSIIVVVDHDSLRKDIRIYGEASLEVLGLKNARRILRFKMNMTGLHGVYPSIALLR